METQEKLQFGAQGCVSAEVLLALLRLSSDWMRPIPIIESNLIWRKTFTETPMQCLINYSEHYDPAKLTCKANHDNTSC